MEQSVPFFQSTHFYESMAMLMETVGCTRTWFTLHSSFGMAHSSMMTQLKRLVQREIARQRKEMSTVTTTSILMLPIVVGLTVALILVVFFLLMTLIVLPLSSAIVPSDPLFDSNRTLSVRPRRALGRFIYTERGLNFAENFLTNPLTYVTGFNLFLGMLLLIVLAAPRPVRCRKKSDSFYKLLGAIAYIALLGLSYGTPLATTLPIPFWILYAVFAFGIVTLLVHAYVPSPAYYSDLQHTRYDHWWTGRDFPNYFQALFSLFLTRIGAPFGFVLDIGTEMVANRWLWRGLSPAEQRTLMAVLTALADHDELRARSLLANHPPTVSGQVIYVLNKLDIASPAQRKLLLTSRGEQAIFAIGRSP